MINIEPRYLNNKFIEKVGLESKKDKHISNMCSGKAILITINHKVEVVAKAVEETIDNKGPPIVEVGPAREAVISQNHTKFKDEIPPLSDNDMDEEVNESTNEEQNAGHAEDLIKLSASSLLPPQAKETSNNLPNREIVL